MSRYPAAVDNIQRIDIDEDEIKDQRLFCHSLEPLLPPPVGAPEVPGLEREGEEKVVGGGFEERVPPPREVGQAGHLAVVEGEVVVVLVRKGHLVEASAQSKEKSRKSHDPR